MNREGSFIVLFVLPLVIFVGIFSLRHHVMYSELHWRQVALGEVSRDPTIFGRRRGPNGKILTNYELSLMKYVDELTKVRRSGNFTIATGNRDVERTVQLRRWHGVPTPVILKWSTQGEDNDKETLYGSRCGGCRVTMDRSALNESVAVVFFLKDHKELPDPKTRTPQQVYVFWSVETPSKLVHMKQITKRPNFDPIFNLTLNFRRDSDVVQYYGTRELALRHSKEKENNGQLDKIFKEKSRLAVWYVSNCYRIPGAIARMRYVMEMVKAGLKLDKFGDCFDHTRVPGSVAGQSHRYKFYLAFENSIHCPGYVSEKFWRNALDGVMVPIIFGPTKEDVEAVAPENSYLHVDDFESPAQLVKYINYLDSNDTAYMEYHKWRRSDINEILLPEDFEKYTSPSYCRLCRRQVLEAHPPKIIPSISKWMFDTSYVDDECLTPRYRITEEEKKEMDEFFATPNAYK